MQCARSISRTGTMRFSLSWKVSMPTVQITQQAIALYKINGQTKQLRLYPGSTPAIRSIVFAGRVRCGVRVAVQSHPARTVRGRLQATVNPVGARRRHETNGRRKGVRRDWRRLAPPGAAWRSDRRRFRKKALVAPRANSCERRVGD